MSTVPTPPAPDDDRRGEPLEPAQLEDVRTYPIPIPYDDARFSFGLTSDVAKVLAQHGYPPIVSGDFVALQQALFGFLYRDGRADPC